MEAYLSQFYLWVGWQPYTWFNVFMLATIADAVLTLYGLSKGAKEWNPAMRIAMKAVGAPVALFVFKSIHAAMVFSTLQLKILWLPVAAIFFVLLCLWNIGVMLYKLRRHA